MKKYYITTSIPYVNGSPHLGHALEYVQADTVARYYRKQGYDVMFATGTDEHGTKVYEKATELQKDPKLYTDELSAVFLDVLTRLNISHNRFIRTSDDAHKQRAQLIWKAMEADIYKSTYSGLYDVTQEEFVPESQADPERLKPDHPKAYQRLEEENYFFRMSKYTDAVKKAIESDTLKITPVSRKNEIMSVLEQGLTDISISRPASKLPWGCARSW